MSNQPIIFSHEGFCDICEQDVSFEARNEWFRDHLLCASCGSIPRERALMNVVKKIVPAYRDKIVHESSPTGRGASLRLSGECDGYTCSHYFPNLELGSIDPQRGIRNENLEQLTFEDESIDLLVTQDVMEHVFDPEAAFREIGRSLRPGGAHIFTVPLINKGEPTQRWSSQGDDGAVVFHHEPEYHGNPIDPEGSPVTMHWGYDIAEFIMTASGMASTIFYIDDIERGIRAEYIEVIVSRKPL